MSDRRLVVIESPLSGNFARNRRYALWCALDCYNRGEAAYASHLVFPFFLDDRDPAHREFGITAGYAWAKHADLVAFYLDLGHSDGTARAWKRWFGTVEIQSRLLPTDMLSAFERGEYPPCTPGFEVDNA